MNIVFTVIALSFLQLIALAMAWASFAAVDPISALDFASEEEDKPSSVIGNIIEWPASVWRMFKLFPPVAIIDLGGYIAMLWFFGPGVAVAVFVLNHLIAHMMVRK